MLETTYKSIAVIEDPGFAKTIGTPSHEIIPVATEEAYYYPELHIEGHWHMSAHLWMVIEEVEIDGEVAPGIVFQVRGNVNQGGLLDTSVAGHVDEGKTPEQTYIAEAEEEVGITNFPNEVHDLGYAVEVKPWSNKEGVSGTNRELQKVLITIVGKNLASIPMAEETEVSGLIALHIKDAIEMFSGKKESVNGVRKTLKGQLWIEEPINDVAIGGFIEKDENNRFYLSACFAAQRLIESGNPDGFNEDLVEYK